MSVEVRLAILAVLGVVVGSLLNLATYRLAWSPRPISPWGPAPPEAPPRRWTDRIPIVGWWGLRRESSIHGRGFWLRPMAVELLTGFAFAALYQWEVVQLGLIPAIPAPNMPVGWAAVFHGTYFAHIILICFMVVGSLIDIDEKILPDTITVPGTWVGLMLAASHSMSLLPAVWVPGNKLIPPIVWKNAPPSDWRHLLLTEPQPWPAWLDGFPNWQPLLIGLACWWLWCVALMPRSWYTRHGYCRAVGLSLARLRRDRSTPRILVMGLIGSVAVAGVWMLGGPWWQGLLTALVGMVASGGLVWVVRIIGTAVLGREAMGFGDVTLMAMIGTFLGWQACLLVFFVAPLAGLVVGLLILILHRETEIAYGPYLCLGTLVVIVFWRGFWDWSITIFQMGLLVPMVVGICMGLMALMLGIWRLIRSALTGE
jgi:prepilin signal peptidase PulO-like enzyme (type II secretory pathway)